MPKCLIWLQISENSNRSPFRKMKIYFANFHPCMAKNRPWFLLLSYHDKERLERMGECKHNIGNTGKNTIVSYTFSFPVWSKRICYLREWARARKTRKKGIAEPGRAAFVKQRRNLCIAQSNISTKGIAFLYQGAPDHCKLVSFWR